MGGEVGRAAVGGVEHAGQKVAYHHGYGNDSFDALLQDHVADVATRGVVKGTVVLDDERAPALSHRTAYALAEGHPHSVAPGFTDDLGKQMELYVANWI